MDVTDRNAVEEAVRQLGPDVIVHLAGIKDLTFCEANPDIAYSVNYRSTQYLVDAAAKAGSSFVLISSDYVFDGNRGNFKEDDKPQPSTVYGKTKELSETCVLEASSRHAIVRTSAVYGKGGLFFSWIMESLSGGKSVEAFSDAYFTPTFVGDVVWAFASVIDRGLNGIFHVAGQSVVSRYEMAKQIALLVNADPELVKSASVDKSGLLIAHNSSLNCSQTSKVLQREFLTLSQGLENIFGLQRQTK